MISVLFRGRHFQGSPFKLNVTDKPVFRRDYETVGDQPVVKFGSKGNKNGQFDDPNAVACDLEGNIIVADTDNHRIQVFDQDGKFLFKFGSSFDNGNDQFGFPRDVAIDHQNGNQIVIVDKNNHRIQIFDEKGGFIRSFGSKGEDDGQLNNPKGVVVDQSNGNYFVADSDNHRVQIFDSNGTFLREFGSQGEADGQFSQPWGIGLLSNGNIVVSDYNNSSLQIFDSAGNFVRVLAGKGKLRYPQHLFVDSDDNILMANSCNGQIQVFTEKGNHVKTIGMGILERPAGVCMDFQGRVIVRDEKNCRISIF